MHQLNLGAICITLFLAWWALSSHAAAQSAAVVDAFPNLRFHLPVDLQCPPGTSSRLYVVELGGVIRSFENRADATEITTVLNIDPRVWTQDESGLVGMAFHPRFADNHQFFVCYITRDTARENMLFLRISRFTMRDDNPLVADPESEKVVLNLYQPEPTHNGGGLAFGADGYLYISLGDGGYSSNPDRYSINAQDLTNLYGSILRIDVDTSNSTHAYGIPPDNPFVDNEQNWRREIWAYGFRNPWRFSIDKPSGRMFAGDVGQFNWEEVNLVKPAQNYGWPIVEGNRCNHPAFNCDTTGLTPPLYTYRHSPEEGVAVTGGYVYRGLRLPGLYNQYIYGDFVSGNIWALRYDEPGAPVERRLLVRSGMNISSFGIDADGEVYICDFNGGIHRLDALLSADSPAGSQPHATLEADAGGSIRFDVPGKCTARLSVFGMQGRERMVLVDGEVSAGRHYIEFDPLELPSGHYYCRLSTRYGVETAPLVVVR